MLFLAGDLNICSLGFQMGGIFLLLRLYLPMWDIGTWSSSDDPDQKHIRHPPRKHSKVPQVRLKHSSSLSPSQLLASTNNSHPSSAPLPPLCRSSLNLLPPRARAAIHFLRLPLTVLGLQLLPNLLFLVKKPTSFLTISLRIKAVGRGECAISNDYSRRRRVPRTLGGAEGNRLRPTAAAAAEELRWRKWRNSRRCDYGPKHKAYIATDRR